MAIIVPEGGEKPPTGPKSVKTVPDGGKKPPAGLKTAKTVPEGRGWRDAAAGVSTTGHEQGEGPEGR